MNGLINRSIQCFVRDAYGEDRWRAVARAVGVGAEGYELMLDYPDDETDRLVRVGAAELGKDEPGFLEDLGTYLVCHDTMRGVRRLLRFCGETYFDFLHALYDLPSRAQMAMPGLVLPELEVRQDAEGQLRIFVLAERAGWGDVLLGLLRAMADDYGVLVLMERGAGSGGVSVIEIVLLDGHHAAARDFSLVEDGATGKPDRVARGIRRPHRSKGAPEGEGHFGGMFGKTPASGASEGAELNRSDQATAKSGALHADGSDDPQTKAGEP